MFELAQVELGGKNRAVGKYEPGKEGRTGRKFQVTSQQVGGVGAESEAQENQQVVGDGQAKKNLKGHAQKAAKRVQGMQVKTRTVGIK